jgi:DNA-binding IclR family transcriptional regulator
MERVRDALQETVQLATLDGRYNVYLAKIQGSQRLVLVSEVGYRLEAHATGLGKVLLAGLDPGERARRLGSVSLESFTTNTITDHRLLEEELQRVDRLGYALDNEEYTVGVRCVAVPIRDHTGQVVAAMSISAPTVRFSPELQQNALRLLKSAAADVARALGYRERAEIQTPA